MEQYIPYSLTCDLFDRSLETYLHIYVYIFTYIYLQLLTLCIINWCIFASLAPCSESAVLPLFLAVSGRYLLFILPLVAVISCLFLLLFLAVFCGYFLPLFLAVISCHFLLLFTVICCRYLPLFVAVISCCYFQAGYRPAGN